ncbi:hypothetical protein [Sphingomonas phage Birtae]|nr:hypothetical protein [Sphingomonas phage Birtae]
MVAYSFNPAQFAPSYGGGDSLPPGKHPVVVSKVHLQPTKDGQNGFMALTLTAIDGPNKGGSKTDRLNLHHTNQDTVRIANQQLSAYCAVMGITGPWQDTDVLMNKPFVVEIVQQAGNDRYTDVTALYTMDGRSVQEAAQNPPQSQGNAPAGFGASGNTPNNQGGGGNPSGGGWGAGAGGSPGAGSPAGGNGGGWQMANGADTGNQGGGNQGGAPAGGGWGGGAAAGGGAPAGGGGWQQGAGGGGGSGWGQQA